MNLIVDIGNSLLKVAVMDLGQELYAAQYADERELNVAELLAAYPQIERAIVASSGVSTASIAGVLREQGLWVLEMTPLTPVPIGNDYQSPETLGVDRLATWTYRGGYGTSVAAKDPIELWDRIGENYKRVLVKE